MLDSIRFLDLKRGPIKDIILPERNDAKFSPKTLNIKNRINIIKNWIKYFIDFIYLTLNN